MMIPRTGGIHAQALLRVGTIRFGNPQTVYRERTSCRTGELGIVVEMHAASQHHVALFFQCHGLHHVVNVSCLQLLGRHTKAVAAQGDHSQNYYIASHTHTFRCEKSKLMNRKSHVFIFLVIN